MGKICYTTFLQLRNMNRSEGAQGVNSPRLRPSVSYPGTFPPPAFYSARSQHRPSKRHTQTFWASANPCLQVHSFCRSDNHPLIDTMSPCLSLPARTIETIKEIKPSLAPESQSPSVPWLACGQLIGYTILIPSRIPHCGGCLCRAHDAYLTRHNRSYFP